MSITSTRTAFWWMFFALLLSAYVLLTDFAHTYNVPYWDAEWLNMIMNFLLQYAWKLGFVVLLIAIGLGTFLIGSHIYYYGRIIYKKIKGKYEDRKKNLASADIEEIRVIAHSIWVKEGHPYGHDIDHWLKAQKIWKEKQKRTKLL